MQQSAQPAPPDERCLITVLFADVVGSTAMEEALDPEQVAEIMNRVLAFMNASVAKHGGMAADLMGDTTNLASRLQSAAPPGGILISHETFRQVRGLFQVTRQPPTHVKGKTAPIQTYVVRSTKPRLFRTTTRGVAGIHTRTIGRTGEVDHLQEA